MVCEPGSSKAALNKQTQRHTEKNMVRNFLRTRCCLKVEVCDFEGKNSFLLRKSESQAGELAAFPWLWGSCCNPCLHDPLATDPLGA